MEATACSALISAGLQACSPKCKKPRMPQVWSAMSSGTAAPPTRFTPDPASTRSRYSSGVPSGTGRYGSRRSFIAANTGSASNGTSPRGSGSTGSRNGHSASSTLRPRAWSFLRRNATSAPRNSARIRTDQLSTSWRFRDETDMRRSATLLTRSSSRCWCKSELSRVARVATWLRRPPSVLVSARSLLDQVRPSRATTSAPFTPPPWIWMGSTRTPQTVPDTVQQNEPIGALSAELSRARGRGCARARLGARRGERRFVESEDRDHRCARRRRRSRSRGWPRRSCR